MRAVIGWSLLRVWLFPLLFLSCAEIQEATEENGADAALSAGIPALTGAALKLSSQAQVMTGLVLPLMSGRAVGCGLSASTDLCASGGKKSASYANCTAGSTEQKYQGSVLLQYSDTAGCTLNDQEESVTRTLEISRTLQYTDFPRFNGTTLETTTEEHVDYRGVDIGSGTRLTKVASSPDQFELQIFGVHKVLTNSKGRKVYDVSIRTTSAVAVTGDLTTDRTLNGGAVEFIHNEAQYVVSLSPSALRYNNTSCCHPTSGSLDVTFSGKIIGTGTLTFESPCGHASLTRDGDTTDLVLHGCE